ncbi:hypothetical protein KKF92_01435 [Patescibacteria group bacterium]|nr:hypothetical protein [Patescibacteria group bacterium]
MKCWLIKIDKFLDTKLPLVILLSLVVLLRLPNFFEPYWYGDEAIYLTVGQSINAGQKLYAQIIDHKTPLIYYLARVPNQFSFRLLLMGWMLISTWTFFQIAKKLFKSCHAVMTASVLFVLLTTLPWLEGHIPNGELFVMGFVLVGGWLLTKTKLWQALIDPKTPVTKPLPFLDLPRVLSSTWQTWRHKRWLKKWRVTGLENFWLLLGGILLGLGILTKVPGLFDVAGWGLIGWFILTNSLPNSRATSQVKEDFAKSSLVVIQKLSLLVAGILLPLILSAIYFGLLGAGPDYLRFGLLYNFHYAGNWGLPFTNPLLLKFFTLPGKLGLATLLVLILTVFRHRFSGRFQFIAGWLILALFGSLLSNRPYPHYFQQLVPPVMLLVGYLIEKCQVIYGQKKFYLNQVWSLTMSGLLLFLITSTFLLLGFRPYAVGSYYSSWLKLVTGQQSSETYKNSFNHLLPDNYKLSTFLKQTQTKRLFIWGTNPALYALSQTVPVGRFTVSFHIIDISAYDETMQALIQTPPPYIVVMKDELAPFPEFYQFLNANYMPNSTSDQYQYMNLWKYAPNLSP